MTLLAPDLFERRFGDLMEIGRAKLPALAPDWTDHNAHDPGITLMELLAWVAEAQLYSVARRPRRDERLAYAALFGLTAGGTQPARGVLWPDPSDLSASVVIRRDAVVNVVNEETPTFRPTHDLLFVPGRIQRLETRLANGGTIDHTATNARGGTPFLPFGESAGPRDVLLLTFRGLFETQKGALWPIGIRSTVTATLIANGERTPLRVVSDTTNGLLGTGVLLLDVDAVAAAPREVTLELSAPEGFARPPRWLRIEPNVVPIEQGRPVEREVHTATGLPDFSFTLELPGLRFAPGQEAVKVEIDEPDALREWQRSDGLSSRGPDDRVFELDAARGVITFGNGINGKIPPAESQVLVSYAVCDADRGNVARNRKWRVAGFQGTFGTNPDPVAGGAAAAGAVDQRRDARGRSRDEHALVSADDLAKAAKELPLLDVARAWVLPPRDDAPRTGAVTLVAMRVRPGGKEPAQIPETRRWLDAVRRQLVTRMPLGTRLVVAAPRYADFTLRATILSEGGRDPKTIDAAVRSELAKRLSLTERRPGVGVTRRDVGAWLRGVEGVKSVPQLQLLDANGKAVDEIAVSRSGLPRLDLNRATLEVRRS